MKCPYCKSTRDVQILMKVWADVDKDGNTSLSNRPLRTVQQMDDATLCRCEFCTEEFMAIELKRQIGGEQE